MISLLLTTLGRVNICPIIKQTLIYIIGTKNVCFYKYTNKRKNTSFVAVEPNFGNKNLFSIIWCSFSYLCMKNTLFVLIICIRVRLIIGQMLLKKVHAGNRGTVCPWIDPHITILLCCKMKFLNRNGEAE